MSEQSDANQWLSIVPYVVAFLSGGVIAVFAEPVRQRISARFFA